MLDVDTDTTVTIMVNSQIYKKKFHFRNYTLVYIYKPLKKDFIFK